MLSAASSIASCRVSPIRAVLEVPQAILPALARTPLMGGDIDDTTPPALPHQRDSLLCRQQSTCDVDRDRRVPPIELDFSQRRCAGDSRIVHEDVASTEVMSKPLEQCRDGLRCRHIHVSAGRPPASRRDSGGHILARLPSRSAITTVNPSADSRRAIASPMPAAPPVTTATAESPTERATNRRPPPRHSSLCVSRITQAQPVPAECVTG
jgi:hypothetical protein